MSYCRSGPTLASWPIASRAAKPAHSFSQFDPRPAATGDQPLQQTQRQPILHNQLQHQPYRHNGHCDEGGSGSLRISCLEFQPSGLSHRLLITSDGSRMERHVSVDCATLQVQWGNQPPLTPPQLK
jgi:hypothetical protein